MAGVKGRRWKCRSKPCSVCRKGFEPVRAAPVGRQAAEDLRSRGVPARAAPAAPAQVAGRIDGMTEVIRFELLARLGRAVDLKLLKRNVAMCSRTALCSSRSSG